MIIQTFPSGPYRTNAYLVVCEETGEGAVIDPAPGSASPLFKAAGEVDIKKILLTHSHWDHIADCRKVADHFEAPVLVHREDAENLRNPGSDGLPAALDNPIPGVEPAELLAEGQVVKVGNLLFDVLHTPGHSPGQVCFYSAQEGALFCGDLLFKGAMGSLALPTSEADRMWPSLRRIASLPPETNIYPGHGSATTVERESWLERAEQIYGGSLNKKGDTPWEAKR